MRKVTIADVASEAGVSKSTISQFLNKRYEYMSEDTKIKIEEAIIRLDYQPNFFARNLKQKQTDMIGIIVADILHQFSTEIIRAIEDYFIKNGIHAILCNADNSPIKEKKYVEMLRSKQVDGLIVFPTNQDGSKYQSLIEQKYPIVFIDRKIEGINIPTIKSANTEATYNMIEYFIKQKHKKIAFISQPLGVTPRNERLAGYKKALSDYKINFDQRRVIHDDLENISSRLEQMFENDPPTAIFAANDLTVVEVLRFANDRGLHIGDNLSLASFDDILFADFTLPKIATIKQSTYKIGHEAAEMLHKMIKQEDEQSYVDKSLPCQLIFRN